MPKLVPLVSKENGEFLTVGKAYVDDNGAVYAIINNPEVIKTFRIDSDVKGFEITPMKEEIV